MRCRSRPLTTIIASEVAPHMTRRCASRARSRVVQEDGSWINISVGLACANARAQVLFFPLTLRTSDMDYSQLSNPELLELAIGVRGAKRLYRGALAPLFAPREAANRYHRKLGAAKELHRRWLAEELGGQDVLGSPGAVRDYLRVYFAGQEHESFVTLFLTMQNRLIVAEEIFRGTLSQTSVYPREIVKRALQVNAGGAIFAHNHPSGVCEPSRADELLTQTLKQALALVEVRVLDHIVVAGDKAMSFAERGLV